MAQRTDVRLLIADDDRAMASMLADGLADIGYAVSTATDAATALRLVAEPTIDVVLTDLRMPEVDGIEILAASKRVAPERPVLVMTAFGAIDTAVESLRKGAYHYLLKPFKVAELDLYIQRALEEQALRTETRTLKRAFREHYGGDAVISSSGAMQQVRELVLRVADADLPVLFTGETGTGKGMLARFLHARSRRASRAFVAVNCAALPENLLESELFGHVKGAFTGAVANRTGLFVEADSGTLFLDEIGDMSPALQAKLLDVLERGYVRAVGASRERQVDVRIVAATHRDLAARVASGHFREDLLYRLEGIVVPIPALRERRDDIPRLVDRFIVEARAATPRALVERLSPEATARVCDHTWPGNVRELQNAISRIVLLGRSTEASVEDLPPAIRDRKQQRSAIEFGEEVIPVRELQRRYAAWALERSAGRKSLACEKLGIDVKTLNKWLASDEREE